MKNAPPTRRRALASPPVLLCSDLAIRSGTATRMAPEHYDRTHRTLTFTTKYGEKLTLPTTRSHRAAARRLRHAQPRIIRTATLVPATGQPSPAPVRNETLAAPHTPRRFRQALKEHSASLDHLTPHDLRRTTAVAITDTRATCATCKRSLDTEACKSTIWYLDHDLEPSQPSKTSNPSSALHREKGTSA